MCGQNKKLRKKTPAQFIKKEKQFEKYNHMKNLFKNPKNKET